LPSSSQGHPQKCGSFDKFNHTPFLPGTFKDREGSVYIDPDCENQRKYVSKGVQLRKYLSKLKRLRNEIRISKKHCSTNDSTTQNYM
jgi:hypothetical protein